MAALEQRRGRCRGEKERRGFFHFEHLYRLIWGVGEINLILRNAKFLLLLRSSLVSVRPRSRFARLSGL